MKPKIISTKHSGMNVHINALNNLPIDAKLYIEEKEQDLLAKEETIQILQAKIRRLEHLSHLKDIRLGDLQQRINMLEYRENPRNKFRTQMKRN
ncbi:hypothetical protein A3Q56_01402 [Intoshia linei]|uniref:Uncharacterized protein n=1 Tax=Intoshia linei TaxID=1819745 RepID=A0A177BAZ3_9BILA|nr:hypothetical protein A3Q56_01402 [Intoshia linei]